MNERGEYSFNIGEKGEYHFSIDKKEESYSKGEVADELIEEATQDLKDIGLEWKNFKGKGVLEIGAGKAKIGQVAKKKGVKYFSSDISDDIRGIPRDIRYVRADSAAMPFKDKSFDFVLAFYTPPAFARVDFPRSFLEELPKERKRKFFKEEAPKIERTFIKKVIGEAMRVLKRGGELRFCQGPFRYDLFNDENLLSKEERFFIHYDHYKDIPKDRFSEIVRKKLGITLDEFYTRAEIFYKRRRPEVDKRIEKRSFEFLQSICPNVKQERNEKGKIFYILRKT